MAAEAPAVAIVVHEPRDRRSAYKAFKKHGASTRYRSLCGRDVQIATGVVIRKCKPLDDGPSVHLVAGPDPRYFVTCPACLPTPNL